MEKRPAPKNVFGIRLFLGSFFGENFVVLIYGLGYDEVMTGL
jgi:hypothetical protein